MSNKLLLAGSLAITALSSSVVMAADTARHSIEVRAVVPSAVFYALPVDANLINGVQQMKFNPNTMNLDEIRGQFDLLNTGGKIDAKLDGPATLLSGSDTIDLDVSINGVSLDSTASKTVLADTLGKTKYRSALVISAKGKDHKAGDYTGYVNLVFDAGI
ncbi:CS1 type fimbrial major subunit [Pseudomonas sp. CCNWLW23]|uniref:CS1 type fimbrial major subunit n=1 Tax=Pseudomonas sp. CCNWLW23 TaxID=3126385 RepID=UPI0030131144